MDLQRTFLREGDPLWLHKHGHRALTIGSSDLIGNAEEPKVQIARYNQ